MFPMGNTIQRGGTELFKRLVDQGWEPAFTTKTVIQKNRDEDGREYDVPMVLPVLEMKKEEEKVQDPTTSNFKMDPAKLLAGLFGGGFSSAAGGGGAGGASPGGKNGEAGS